MKKLLTIATALLTITTAQTTKADTLDKFQEKASTYLNEAKNSTLFNDLKDLGITLYNEINSELSTTNTQSTDVLVDLENLNRVETLPNLPYDRTEYKHWVNLTPGWNTREEVLNRNAETIQIENNRVVSGVWYDYYTDKELTRVKDIDIDHVIALKLANNMGAYYLSPEQKQEFANDFDNLVVSYNRVNRAKSDKGPSQWMPENPENAKEYAIKFVQAAKKYNLTISNADYNALLNALQ